MSLVRTKIHTSSPLYCFGDNIKKLRKEYKLSQQQFAINFNVSIDAVKNWEQHYSIPEMDCLLRLCDFFNCDLDFLFGRIKEKTHTNNFIHKTTGLNESSINNLINCKGKICNTQCINALNHLLNDYPNTCNFLHIIGEYKDTTNKILDIYNSPITDKEDLLIDLDLEFTTPSEKKNKTRINILHDIRYETNSQIRELLQRLELIKYKASNTLINIINNISKDIPQYYKYTRSK